MPIRAENRPRYPSDWAAISLRIRRDRADWRCEQVDYLGVRCDALHGEPHPITGSRVVLTVAHLDHTPENCHPDNLRAMCQRCHNRYDADERRRGIAERQRAAQSTADLIEAPGLPTTCGCRRCIGEALDALPDDAPWHLRYPGPGVPGWRYACEVCGNKRCPHQRDHRLACTGSNAPGQKGSYYA